MSPPNCSTISLNFTLRFKSSSQKVCRYSRDHPIVQHHFITNCSRPWGLMPVHHYISPGSLKGDWMYGEHLHWLAASKRSSQRAKRNMATQCVTSAHEHVVDDRVCAGGRVTVRSWRKRQRNSSHDPTMACLRVILHFATMWIGRDTAAHRKITVLSFVKPHRDTLVQRHFFLWANISSSACTTRSAVDPGYGVSAKQYWRFNQVQFSL